MDDHNFQVVRKNLNILSVLILVLGISNAQLQEINFLGIQMKLSPQKFYIALFIGYTYFIWRYWTKLNFKGGFWNEFIQFYMTSEDGVKKEHSYERYKGQFESNSEDIRNCIIANDPNFRLTQLTVTRMDPDSITKLVLNASFVASVSPGQPTVRQFQANQDIVVSPLLVCRKLLWFSFRYDKFGDELFPLLLVAITMLFVVLKPDWQGSLSSLIHP